MTLRKLSCRLNVSQQQQQQQQSCSHGMLEPFLQKEIKGLHNGLGEYPKEHPTESFFISCSRMLQRCVHIAWSLCLDAGPWRHHQCLSLLQRLIVCDFASSGHTQLFSMVKDTEHRHSLEAVNFRGCLQHPRKWGLLTCLGSDTSDTTEYACRDRHFLQMLLGQNQKHMTKRPDGRLPLPLRSKQHCPLSGCPGRSVTTSVGRPSLSRPDGEK